MRRLYLKFVLWRAGYCPKHMRKRQRFVGGLSTWLEPCPDCNREVYEEAHDRIDRRIKELEKLNAAR